MAEGLDSARLELEKTQVQISNTQLGIIKEFKSSVDSGFAKAQTVFKGISGNFSFKNLQNNIGNIFTTTAKSFTTKIKDAGNSIGTSFSKLKGTIGGMFANLNPMKALSNLKGKVTEKVGKVKEKVNKFLGRDLESLQKKFFSRWANPKKVAKIFGKYSGNHIVSYYSGSGSSGLTKSQKKFYKNWENPQKAAKEFVKGLGIGKLFNAAGGGKGKAKPGKSVDLGELVSSIAGVIRKIGTAIDIIAASIVWFFSGGGFGIGLAIGLSGPVALLCGTLLLVGFMMGDKLIEGLNLLLDNLPGLIEKGVLALKTLLVSIFSSIPDIIEAIVAGLVGAFPALIVGFIEGVVHAVGLLITRIPIILVGLVKDMISSFFGGSALSFGGTLAKGVTGIFKKKEKETKLPYKKILNNILEELKKLNEKDFSGDLHKLLPTKEEIKTSFVNGFNYVKNIFKDIKFPNKEDIRAASEYFDKGVQKIKNYFNAEDGKEMIAAVKSKFNDVKNYLKSEEGKEMIATVKSTFNGVKKFITDTFSSANTKGTGEITNKVSSFFNEDITSNKFDELISTFNKNFADNKLILSKIEEAVTKISNSIINISPVNTQPGTAKPSDTDNLNNMNITVDNSSSISDIITQMNIISSKLDSIISNTKQKDSDNNQTIRPWSI